MRTQPCVAHRRCRLTPQFSGRALPREARHERIMKWSARAVAATPCHGPLQLLVRRLAQHAHSVGGLQRSTPPSLATKMPGHEVAAAHGNDGHTQTWE